MTDSKIIAFMFWIAMIGIIGTLLCGCTIKLARVTQTYDDLDSSRYQIIESYKQGMADMVDMQKQAEEYKFEYENDDLEGL